MTVQIPADGNVTLLLLLVPLLLVVVGVNVAAQFVVQPDGACTAHVNVPGVPFEHVTAIESGVPTVALPGFENVQANAGATLQVTFAVPPPLFGPSVAATVYEHPPVVAVAEVNGNDAPEPAAGQPFAALFAPDVHT